MKHLYNMAWGLLLVAGLASCEMKNELFDEKGSGETGVLEIGVAVNKAIDNVATRAGEDDAEEGVAVPVEGDEVAADGFEIDITGADNYSKQLIYNSGEANSISLPVGTYTVYAHTPGEMARVMDDPYYGGTTTNGTIAITSGVTSTASIKCVMENTRIMLGYDDQFLATYKSWNITVENGSDDQVLTAIYDGTGEPPVIDKYWDLGDGVASVLVKGTAVLKDGGATVPVSKVLTKVNGEDFVGAEALNITLVLGSGGVSGSLAGVDVVVNLFGTEPDSDQTVEVPIETEDDNDPPVTPPVGDDAPTLSGEYLTKTANIDKADSENMPNIEVVMTIPNKIQNVFVSATTSDSQLEGIFEGMGFMDGDGVDLVTASDLSTLFELPTTDDTEYKFVLGGLADFLTVGTHTFTVKVIDQKGLSATGTLNIVVTNSTAQGE